MTEIQDPTWIPIEFDPEQQIMSGVATHGNTPFSVPYISEIAPNLYQGGCRNKLALPHYIKHLLSLYQWEEYWVRHELLSSLTVEMYDSTDQGFEQVDDLARYVNECRKTGPILVHCQAGLNRSSLVVAKALILEGMEPQAAIDLIRRQRSPACLCNPSFLKWLWNTDRSL